jgi:DNA-directed RNA polymerase subunit H (RpoH/RPB5)
MVHGTAADLLWRVREHVLLMCQDRGYAPHPDLFLDQAAWLQLYRREKENPKRSSLFTHCMTMVVHLEKQQPEQQRQGGYRAPSAHADITGASCTPIRTALAELDAIAVARKLKPRTLSPTMVVLYLHANLGIDPVTSAFHYIRQHHGEHGRVLCIYEDRFTNEGLKVLRRIQEWLHHRPHEQQIQWAHADMVFLRQPSRMVQQPASVRALSATEEAQELAKWKLRKEQIPKFMHDDLLVQWYGFPAGTTVKILLRRDLHRPEYRVVAPSPLLQLTPLDPVPTIDGPSKTTAAAAVVVKKETLTPPSEHVAMEE